MIVSKIIYNQPSARLRFDVCYYIILSLVLTLILVSSVISQKKSTGSVVALKGCVIIKQDNKGVTSRVVYKKKCEFCAWVSNSIVTTSVSNSSNTIYNSSFICPECKKRNVIKIQGTR